MKHIHVQLRKGKSLVFPTIMLQPLRAILTLKPFSTGEKTFFWVIITSDFVTNSYGESWG